MKWWTAVLISLVSLAIGVWGGVAASQYFAEQTVLVHQAQEFVLLQDRLKSAATQGNLLEYEAAPWTHIALLDRFRKADSVIVGSDRVHLTDRAIAYVRLAGLATRQEQSERERLLMTKAVQECEKAGRDLCGTSDLKRMVDKLDASWLGK